MTATAADAATADLGPLATRLRRLAEAAAREAAPALGAAFRGGMEIGYKADLHDPVTEHYRRAEAVLRARLLAEAPGSAFLGEEAGLSGEGPLNWIVDPIDGTANFAAGLAFWCISIAAVQEGRILAGVVLDPVAGTLFAADLAGAWLNGVPLRPRPGREEASALLLTGYPAARDLRREGPAALDDFGDLVAAFSTLRRPGSAALGLCHLAAGWADAALGVGVNAWDVAAAILILRQSGGLYRPLAPGAGGTGAPDHHLPGYIAHRAGALYPTLVRVGERIEARRREERPPAP
ncbi:MAG: inositol monophosphatase [Rhodobacteraceae bacterium]|nr:inositol monophosphatase [Paracoccaceae bacterium]